MNTITDLRTRRPFTAALPTRFDVHVASMLRDAILRAGHPRVEIDGDAVTFIDAAGLAALAEASEAAVADGGSFTLINPSPALRITLELTNTVLASSNKIAADVVAA